MSHDMKPNFIYLFLYIYKMFLICSFFFKLVMIFKMWNNYKQFVLLGNLLLYSLVLFCMFIYACGTNPSTEVMVEQTSMLEYHPTLVSNSSSDVFDKCIGNCSSLPAQCYNCKWNDSCEYGCDVKFDCEVKNGVSCVGDRTVLITFQCRYCFLTKPNEEHVCFQNSTNCSVTATPQERVKGLCQVNDNIFCLGNRTFSKMMPCSWTSGYKWSTALALSITVGGFGVDRFYLGYWQAGLGKFFSFGGLGVWTIIDVILIGTRYLTPSDGSLYV